MQSMLEQNPNLTFQEVWWELEQSFACDLGEKFREEWEDIVMVTMSFPTLLDYRAHFVQWEAAFHGWLVSRWRRPLDGFCHPYRKSYMLW